MEDDKQRKALPTLDDLMRMGKGVEIYDGEFRSKYGDTSRDSVANHIHYIVIHNLYRLLNPYVQSGDLAVKVVCPTEKFSNANAAIQDSLTTGVKEVWIVYPQFGEIMQYRNSQPNIVIRYVGSTTLDVADLFPNLTLTTDAIFALPDWAK